MQIESNNSTSEFDEFVASGEVEVGDTNVGVKEGDDAPEKKPAAKRGPPKPAAKPAAAADDDAGDDDRGDDDVGDDEGDEEKPKPKKTAAEYQVERLKREKRDLQRQLREGGNSVLENRLAAIESRLTGGNGSDSQSAGTPAPDPSDADKYPLGHLDDRYIEDKLEWLADQKATKTADSVLQRQQENERNAAIEAGRTALLDKVDELASKGSDLFEDFQESVVEAGMRGDYDLGQATFEAAAEADHGPQILYELSQDTKEATRVAKLSSYGQTKYVLDRNAEIASGKKGRTKPQAGEPPKNSPRGANSKTEINPATDNLDDFEKAWKRDAKKSN